MPLKGESASFFSIPLRFNTLAGLSSSFLPSRRSPPPLLRRESWAGEVSMQEPKLSTSSESPLRRATVREPQQRGARGGRLALHQCKCDWSSVVPARLQESLQTAALRCSVSKDSRSAGKDEEAPPCPRPRRATTGDAFVQLGPSKRAKSAQPAYSLHCLPPARIPALCRILPGTELLEALQRQRVILPGASPSLLDGHRSRALEVSRNPEPARAVKGSH